VDSAGSIDSNRLITVVAFRQRKEFKAMYIYIYTNRWLCALAE